MLNFQCIFFLIPYTEVEINFVQINSTDCDSRNLQRQNKQQKKKKKFTFHSPSSVHLPAAVSCSGQLEEAPSLTANVVCFFCLRHTDNKNVETVCSGGQLCLAHEAGGLMIMVFSQVSTPSVLRKTCRLLLTASGSIACYPDVDLVSSLRT